MAFGFVNTLANFGTAPFTNIAGGAITLFTKGAKGPFFYAVTDLKDINFIAFSHVHILSIYRVNSSNSGWILCNPALIGRVK